MLLHDTRPFCSIRFSCSHPRESAPLETHPSTRRRPDGYIGLQAGAPADINDALAEVSRRTGILPVATAEQCVLDAGRLDDFALLSRIRTERHGARDRQGRS
jgi:hypothetical protein